MVEHGKTVTTPSMFNFERSRSYPTSRNWVYKVAHNIARFLNIFDVYFLAIKYCYVYVCSDAFLRLPCIECND